MYFTFTLPEIQSSAEREFKWVKNIGTTIIRSVSFFIQGKKIDEHYGEWLHIWHELNLSADHREGYNEMIGNIPEIYDPANANGNNNIYPASQIGVDFIPSIKSYRLAVPLIFWFNRHPGLALPLIALQYHEVKINIDFRPIGECLFALKADGTTATQAYQQSLVAASLYVDYIFLDTDERRKMAQNPHEYLIEQVQFTGDESVGSSSNKIKLNFNHPCKELIWVVQPDANVDYCSSLIAGNPLYVTHGAQPFNYTDALDSLPNSVAAFGAVELTGGLSVAEASTFVLAETALDMHCWGENPVVTAKLQLNGQDRFSEREGSYFDTVQPFQHHTRAPDSGINVYSFGLRPEEHQPSGSCNFSRIDNAVLQLVLSAGAVSGAATAKVRVYAVNYNVLRVMSGMAGVAYSN